MASPKVAASKHVNLTAAQSISWSLSEGVNEARLFPIQAKFNRFIESGYFRIHQKLKRKGVTLQLLW